MGRYIIIVNNSMAFIRDRRSSMHFICVRAYNSYNLCDDPNNNNYYYLPFIVKVTQLVSDRAGNVNPGRLVVELTSRLCCLF